MGAGFGGRGGAGQGCEVCGVCQLPDRPRTRTRRPCCLPAVPPCRPVLQMTTMLDLMSSYLEAKDVQHCRIDGSICWQDRQAAMAAFNTDPECKVFLLSTRAGGLGINLTAADTCIIYDSGADRRWGPGYGGERGGKRCGAALRNGWLQEAAPCVWIPPFLAKRLLALPPPRPLPPPSLALLPPAPALAAALWLQTGTRTRTCRRWTAATASASRSRCWSSAWPRCTAWRARCCAAPTRS